MNTEDGSEATAAAKARWRAKAAAVRRNLPFDSAAFCRALLDFVDDTVADDLRIVIYDAMATEVDLGDLVLAHRRPHRRYAVTRTPDRGLELTVHPYGTATERHRYGFQQPAADAPRIDPAEIGAVLVPGLAFDRNGVRLGRGKGYYDRFLARLRPNTAFVGITGGYVVDRLPADDFDVAMSHLAFEAGVFAVPLAPGQPGGRSFRDR